MVNGRARGGGQGCAREEVNAQGYKGDAVKTKWTPEERSAAESYAWGCQTGGKRPVSLLEVELACQRNRALAEAMNAKMCLSCEDTQMAFKHLDAAIAACEDQP
jgi:hypothetical protein